MMSYENNRHYQVVKNYDDGSERVVLETENEEKAYTICERLNNCNADFTWCYYSVETC